MFISSFKNLWKLRELGFRMLLNIHKSPVIIFSIWAFTLSAGFSRSSELYFIERPEEIAVIEGAPVNLTCRINQDHGVQYHWEIDGECSVIT